MAKLMNNSSSKKLNLERGDLVEGVVISITGDEVVLDLGIKSEGMISKRDLSADKLEGLKVGSKLKAFVYLPENQSGQIVLTLFEQTLRGNWQDKDKGKAWQKFIRAIEQRTHLNGRVIEINKGGLVIEIEGVRGFLPISQLGLDKVSDSGLPGLVGRDLTVSVLEVDPSSNRLILSSRKHLTDQEKLNLSEYKVGAVVKMQLAAVTQIGLLGIIKNDKFMVEGFVPVFEIAWEKVEDPFLSYQVGTAVEAIVIGTDDQTGRVILSIRQLGEDPWQKSAAAFQVDDVVKGRIVEIDQAGIKVSLDKVEGFVQGENIEPGLIFEVGQTTSFLVSGVDRKRRLVLLAPFITSTKGLIYK